MTEADVPTLEVGFAINFNDSFGQLRSMDDILGQVTADAVREFTRIEQAAKGAINLSGANAQITSFGNIVDREMASATRATNRAEKAGENMVRQLERQIETFGKSATEIRQMRAELRATEAESRGLTELAGRLRAVSAQMDGLESSVTGVGRSRGSLTQLSFQLNDVATMAASGAPAFQIFATQAGQIFQVAQMAEGGVKGFAAEFGGLALRLAPVAIGVGVAAFAFKGLTTTLEQKAPVDDYIKTLGLSAEEVKKLTDTHVTLGDVAGATWDVISKALGLESVFSTLDGWVTRSATWLYGQFKDAAASTYAALKAAYDNVGLLWKNLPALLGDAAVLAVNKTLDAVQSLINEVIGGVNFLAEKSNDIFGTTFGQIGKVDLARFKGQYSAAGQDFGAAFGASFTGAYRKAMGAFDAIDSGAVKNRDERLSDQADELIKDRKKKAEKAAKDEIDLVKWAEEQKLKAYGNVWSLAQDIEKRNAEWGKGSATWGDKDVAAQVEADALKAAGLENARAALDQFMSGLDQISDRVDAVAANMRNAFGSVGGAIGDLVTVLDEYGKRQAEIDMQRALGGLNEKEMAALRRREASNQIDGMVALTSAAKGLFSEHSKGYKAMAAAEKALTVIQLARTAIDVAGGAARMFATLGPFAFPAVAAMLGVMASLGFGGGGSSGTLPSSNDGTGTILGDADAKSDSIKRAIDALREVDTVMLTYSRQMAASLSSIESQIGGFASLVLRTGDINASGGVNTGFSKDAIGKTWEALFTGGGLLSKIPIVGGIIGGIGSIIGSLFGSKTKVVGSGLFGGAQSLEEILAGGFDASYYSDIQKKKKFLGVTTSTKYSTQYADADGELENQFTLILRQFNDAILAAAGPLGASTDEIMQRLNGFVVNIGKIDLQGLTGEEIEEKLTAVFGAAADDMAKAAFPGIERFQQVGEGLFETLVRVASTTEAVTASLGLLGSSAVAMGTDLKMALAGQFESVSDFTSAIESYFETYYIREEQAAARTAQMADVFESLSLAMPSSLAGFRALVEAQDLTTAAGQATYATLLQLAPAFADLQSAMTGAKSAADILSERQDLERQLLELQGNTAAIRALELAQLDESNRALQEQIWAIQDAKEAADAAAELKDAWTSVGDSIIDEVNRIRGITDGSSAGGFASLQGQFNAATAAARAGDQEAAGKLVSLSQSLLNAAGLSATSKQELDRIKALTAASLEQTYAIIKAMGGNALTPPSTASTILSGGQNAASLAAAANAGAATPAPSNDNVGALLDGFREEVEGMRREMTAGLATIAGNTGKIARKLDDVTADSGGQAVSVTGVAR